MQLRTVNKALNAKYPGLELVKGEGYFYFAGAGTEVCCETGVYGVYRLNDFSLDRWIEEADARMAEVAQHAETARENAEQPTRIKLTRRTF